MTGLTLFSTCSFSNVRMNPGVQVQIIDRGSVFLSLAKMAPMLLKVRLHRFRLITHAMRTSLNITFCRCLSTNLGTMPGARALNICE